MECSRGCNLRYTALRSVGEAKEVDAPVILLKTTMLPLSWVCTLVINKSDTRMAWPPTFNISPNPSFVNLKRKPASCMYLTSPETESRKTNPRPAGRSSNEIRVVCESSAIVKDTANSWMQNHEPTLGNKSSDQSCL